MKIQFLHSTFNAFGRSSGQQHLPCFVLDDCVAIDAGSLALSINSEQRNCLRNIVLTHSHLDHIATLPIFIDDLFTELEQPVVVHATAETIEMLEQHIFNWKIFPRFSELQNEFGSVLKYSPFVSHQRFCVQHLELTAIPVNHQIATVGLIISDRLTTIAFTSDTTQTEEFWFLLNSLPRLDALLIECALPNSQTTLAHAAHHLTPQMFSAEMAKLKHKCPVLAINLKPTYRAKIVEELENLKIPRLEIMQVGNVYNF